MADAVERIHVSRTDLVGEAIMAHPRGKSHRPFTYDAAYGRDGREGNRWELGPGARVWGRIPGQLGGTLHLWVGAAAHRPHLSPDLQISIV